MSRSEDIPFVSRAGLKLEHALIEFELDVTDLHCADFGCNVGGFTDCLLQRGAARVFALDTGYGTLAWKLRSDERVVVMERTNALHALSPEGGVDLVTVDLAWTPQTLAIPAALKWLAPSPASRIITLIKPHYELDATEKRTLLADGVLCHDDALRIHRRVLEGMPALGLRVLGEVKSPLTGRKSSRSSGASGPRPGNIEFLALLQPMAGSESRPG